jgi:hypothetical protein
MTEDTTRLDKGNNTPNQTPRPIEHSVRLLYPFWMEPGNLDKAVRALTLQHHAGRKREFNTWQEISRIPDLYREEILPLVSQVLFGIRSGANRYLRVEADALHHWFQQDGLFEPAEAADNGKQPAYSLKPGGEGIELFLSPHGVGLLSLTFDCVQPGGLKALQAFNYRLSQLRPHTAWQYRIPHDPQSPNPPPEAQDPFEQRLGNGGGTFLFKELVDFVLAPLNAYGLLETQQQFSIYSVTRFGHDALFTETDTQAQLKPFLAALAHVEEASHQGSLGISEILLNPRHWAAVGSLGAAHLVADQNPPHPFDQQRLPRSLYKYFVPYLCALLQRLTLQRLLWETDSAVLETDGSLHERQAKLRRLHQDMLRFSLQGCFTEISSREVHNQYYELALAGLRVPKTLQLVQRVLRDMESATTAAYQQETIHETRVLADDVGANVGLMADMQRKVEWLEVFFVSYYATALVHYVGHDFFSAAYTHWSLIATPFLSGIIALLCIKPYAKPQPQETQAKHPHKGAWAFLGVITIVFLTWVAIGWHCFLAENHPDELRNVNCASEANCQPGANQGTI